MKNRCRVQPDGRGQGPEALHREEEARRRMHELLVAAFGAQKATAEAVRAAIEHDAALARLKEFRQAWGRGDTERACAPFPDFSPEIP